MNKKFLGWVLILFVITSCQSNPTSNTSPIPTQTPSKSPPPSQAVSTPLPTPWKSKTSGDEWDIYANSYLADFDALNLSGMWLLVDYRLEGHFSLPEREIRPLLGKTLEFTSDDRIYFDGELCIDQPLLIKTVEAGTYYRFNKIYLRSSYWDELGISSQTFRILWAEEYSYWQCDSFRLGFGILSNPANFVTHYKHTFFVFEHIVPGQPTPTPIPRTLYPRPHRCTARRIRPSRIQRRLRISSSTKFSLRYLTKIEKRFQA